MASRFIHSILAVDQAVAIDGELLWDLPVNPLSALLLKISPLNDTAVITNYKFLEGLLAAIVKLRVSHRGASVIDASGVDLAALAMLYHRIPCWQFGNDETDNVRRCVVLPVLFGRRPWLARECFPETKKGELQMAVTFDVLASGYDTLRISIETIELPEASPEVVQKVTTLAQTFAAVGQQDVDLPIGNVIRGLLLWGNTGFSGASPAPSWGQVSVLRDNTQIYYSATDFEVAGALAGLLGCPWPPDMRHVHSVNAAGAAREDTLEPKVGATLVDQYVLLPFDVDGTDEYAMDTSGAGRVNVRGLAESADAVRVLPIERVAATQFTE